MSAPLRCMFDTTVFNRILDGVITLETLSERVAAHATHIQRDELNSTKDAARRMALAEVFQKTVAESIPTNSFGTDLSRLDEARLGGERVVPTTSLVWDVSRSDHAIWGADDNLCSRLKSELDRRNRGKSNNFHDALIAETSVKGGYVLVTDDSDLTAVTKMYGGKCLSVRELLHHFAQ